jgi:hypothetical protein
LITTPVKEYLQFEAALSLLPALPPAEAAELLRERINELEHRLNFSKLTMENMRKAGLPRLFGVENEYMEALMQAELDYVRSLIKEIEDGTLDGIEMWRRWFECQKPPGGGPPPPEPEE